MSSLGISGVVASYTHMEKLNSHQVRPGNIENVPVVRIFTTEIDNPIIEIHELLSHHCMEGACTHREQDVRAKIHGEQLSWFAWSCDELSTSLQTFDKCYLCGQLWHKHLLIVVNRSLCLVYPQMELAIVQQNDQILEQKSLYGLCVHQSYGHAVLISEPLLHGHDTSQLTQWLF